jgi:hypothetical protein
MQKPARPPWPFPTFILRAGRAPKAAPTPSGAVAPVTLRLPARGGPQERMQLRRMARMLRVRMADPRLTPPAFVACRDALRNVNARLLALRAGV